jgi:hypothetical protein
MADNDKKKIKELDSVLASQIAKYVMGADFPTVEATAPVVETASPPVPSAKAAPGTKAAPRKQKGNPTNTRTEADPSPLTGSISDVDALAVPTEDSLFNTIANRPPAFPVREQPSLPRYDGSEDRKAADERLTKSEDMAAWGDLATRLGNAIIKYSAANEGLKSGVDLSKIQTEAPDFKQFLDTAGRRYKSSLEDVAGKERKSQAELDAEDRKLQQKFSDDVAKYGIDDARDKYLLSTLQKRRAEDTALSNKEADRAWDREKFYADQRLRQQALAQRPERGARPDYTMLKERLDANKVDLKQARSQLEEAGKLSALINSYPSLNKKGQEAADKEISELIGKAGLGATEVAEITQQVEDNRGGWFTSENPEAIKEALDKLAARQRGEVQRLSQEQRQLLGGMSPALPSSSVESEVEEVAPPARSLSPKDQEALDWARKNPSDPRAAAILARLQSK